ncbi:MAG: NYN domain-containing protein [Candidatus Hydrogenedentes bacterium]|nr:NYN domain-containing protein [Candidatus Hydrogenedentota bacterium]
MGNIYYIDGYNIIHHSSYLRPIAENNFEGARDALIEQVSMFCSTAHRHAKIVFDGRGRRPDSDFPLRAGAGLEVVYSPGHQNADSYIERAVYNAPKRADLIVVSGDRGLRNTCYNLGALVMDPENFLTTVREAVKEARDVRHSSQPSKLDSRVEDRLDAGALSRLNELKSKLPKVP